MPQLAIAPTFLNDFSRLDSGIQTAILTVMQAYMAGDREHLEAVPNATDPRVRVMQIGPNWSGIVAPSSEGVYCLVGVRRHEEAVSFARAYRPATGPGIGVVEMSGPSSPAIALPSVRGPVELAHDLNRSFAEWQITLHPDQRRFVDARFAGSARITGGPGTGTTVIALHRAAHLAELDAARFGPATRPSVLLTTVNKLLAQTLGDRLDRLVPDPGVRARIDVVTVDRLARGVVHEHTGILPETLGKEAIGERWRTAARTDGLPYSGRFLLGEWEQVLLAQDITDLSDYIRCERSGRMLHLAPEHRTHVWEAVHRYTAAMRTAGEWSYPQVAQEAARLLRTAGPRYRHIVVDEAQDLHPAQWRLLRAAVAEGPDDLFIVEDPHQRVYDDRVSLASLGINVRGRGHRLRVSYRVTQETLNWAMPILGRPAAVGPDGDADTLAGYRSLLHGPEPVVRGCAGRTEELAALGEWVRGWLEAGVTPSSIALAGRNQWVVRHIAKELYANGIMTAPLDSAEGVDAVRVGTMHKLKGQEFRCVGLVGLSEPLLPPKAAIDATEGDPVALEQVYQQERNLIFGACTRARDALYVSYVGAPSHLLPESARSAH
ncbi:UvrD-helicase domain-containing protein [Actinorugispora endophytica]|uniref:DNA 3'-5' helicase n=1 Tax=Actinorugispora endophytica TaxID=1605990 RepID=A0A4R6UKB9_9ACTN|nr:UvrD-helicase domain-containing protein [Actinorugispora endophytica]TDQ46586.1 UvrD-like helicase family protein [Actinorugispora endophytica]